MKKKILGLGCVSILLIAMAVIIADKEVYEAPLIEEAPIIEPIIVSEEEEYEKALENGADLLFWYDDESYTSYLTEAAVAFYEEEGIVVDVKYVADVDYVGMIYDATMEGEAFPDAYLLSGEELEKAYLFGIAKENTAVKSYEGVVASNAMEASTYGDKVLGYPLSYNVCLLAYNSQYFTEQPASLQAIIDFSDTTEPDENVEYLLEWDVHDPFFDFLFVSNSVVLNKTDSGMYEIGYSEELLAESLVFLEESLESFSIPIDTVTEQSVLQDVVNGKTLCAIIDSNCAKDIVSSGYEIIEFPRLNDTMEAKSVALTDMVLVNDFTEKAKLASEFAQFVTLQQSEILWDMTGHYPVQKQSNADGVENTAYRAYENAILAPNSQDAGVFWVDLNEMITKYFEL